MKFFDPLAFAVRSTNSRWRWLRISWLKSIRSAVVGGLTITSDYAQHALGVFSIHRLWYKIVGQLNASKTIFLTCSRERSENHPLY